MRVFKLVLLGIVCYLVVLLLRFPAAPVVDHFRPQLGPVAIEGVSGPLLGGQIERIASTDDLLPLEASNLRWKPALSQLFTGGGAQVDLEAYGGSTSALVARAWNGDVTVSDLSMTARAKELEPLLPAPIAAFDGNLSANISKILLQAQLLTEFEGVIEWTDAVLERPIAARFGTVRIDVSPNGDDTHSGVLTAAGGDVSGEGNFTLALNGDYSLDVVLTPTANAPSALINSLRSVVNADAQGRYRIQQRGNVNRL